MNISPRPMNKTRLDVLSDHETPDNDQSTTSSPRRNTRKDGRKEHTNKECKPSHHGRDSSLSTFRNTSGALDESGDRAGTHESTHTNAEGVNAVSDGRILEVEGDGIAETGEFGHGVQGSGGIKDIDVEEGNEGIPNATLAIVILQRSISVSSITTFHCTYIDDIANMLQRMERDHLFEEIK